MNSVKIAVGQLCLSSNVARNANTVVELMDQAASLNAKVLFLPEASDYLSRDAGHSVQLAQRTGGTFIAEIQAKLKALAQAGLDLCVAVGVHEPSPKHADKVQNNHIWIGPSGRIEQRYQKIHLFDVSIANGPILQESKSVEAGSEVLPPVAIPGSGFHVGLAICYDIRFPDLATRLRTMGANVLTYPSAFTTKTGEAHWLALGRARAIDTQSYVVMAAQCGEHDVYADTDTAAETEGKKLRVSYGQSVVIGPWGDIVAQAPTYKERQPATRGEDYHDLITATLDLDLIAKVRSDMPVFAHRRPDTY